MVDGTQVRGLSECIYTGCWGPLSLRMMAARPIPSAGVWWNALWRERPKDTDIGVFQPKSATWSHHRVKVCSQQTPPVYSELSISILFPVPQRSRWPRITRHLRIGSHKTDQMKTKCMGKSNLEETDYIGRSKLIRERESKGENSLSA